MLYEVITKGAFDPEELKDTKVELPEGYKFINYITSEEVKSAGLVPLNGILSKFPVALLIGEKE